MPYPRNIDILMNRRNLLRDAIAVDVYGIPKARKMRQRSRTLRYCKGYIRRKQPFELLKITDPRTYETIEKIDSLENLVKKLIEREIGFKLPLAKERKDQTEEDIPSEVVLPFILCSSNYTILLLS